ncbi:hypothetical protein UPYG_G00149890 [Umbra pygmaea]|uniref:Uncharacterized protein n=1 Tax=Umbra pygmaea TaxID=75934 RepID=A0ABD0WX68_UMBPY
MNPPGGQAGSSLPIESGPKLGKETGACGKCVGCGITLSQERNPQLLPCLHSTCQACIPTNHSGIHKDVFVSPTCPSCDLPYNLQEVTDNVILKSSSNELWTGNVKCTCCEELVASGWCTECREALCSECVSAHRRVKVTRDHTIQLQPPKGVSTPTVFCVTHKHEPIKLFCLTCNQLTCRDCQLIDHRNHSFQFFREALLSQKEQIRALVQRLRQQRETVKQSIQDMDGRLLDITETKSKLRESLRRIIIATVQILKARSISIYGYVEHMFDSEVVGIETRRRVLDKLGERQEYIDDFVEKALNLEDFFALLSVKDQIVSQLQCVLSQNTAPPGSMLALQLVVNKDFEQQVSSFCNIIGDIVPFAKSQVSQDVSPSNPETNQGSMNVPAGQNASSTSTSTHPVPAPHDPSLQGPSPSCSATSSPLNQPYLPSHLPPPYPKRSQHPSSNNANPQAVPSTLAPSNSAQQSTVPCLGVQSHLVPTNHAQFSAVLPFISSDLQPKEATPRLYCKFTAAPLPGSGQPRRGKDGKSWTFHTYCPKKGFPPPLHQPTSVNAPNLPPHSEIDISVPNLTSEDLHENINLPECQLLRALHRPPPNFNPVLPVKALADSPCDRGLLPTREPECPGRENEPTSTVTELEGLEGPSAWGEQHGDASLDRISADPRFAGTVGKTATHTSKQMESNQVKENRSEHFTVNHWRPGQPSSTGNTIEGRLSPCTNKTSSLLAPKIPPSKPNNHQPLSSVDVNTDTSTTSWQPRVSLFRLPISTFPPGCHFPQFLLVQGANKNEIILREIKEDPQSYGNDSPPPESDDLQWTRALSSPESPPVLQCVSCAACRTAGGSLLCVACGRGYHRDCHIPPIGPSFWEDWKCSLCQDLDDDIDPYVADRHRTMCLTLADQRKCEHLLLFLRCENDQNILSSTTESPSESICLDSIHGRLLRHRSPPYRTSSEFVSDIWVLFDTILLNSKDQDSIIKLRGNFQVKLGEVFGTSLHPSLLSLPKSSCVERKIDDQAKGPTAAVILNKMRDFVKTIGVAEHLRRQSQETNIENGTKRRRLNSEH